MMRVARWGVLTVAVGIAITFAVSSVAPAAPSVRVTAGASAAPALDVFVGYADSDRANPTVFPTPWDDPTNPLITFEGCHPASNCTFDGGAVRLVNNTGASVSVQSVTITYYAGCTYDIWPHNVALAAGRQLILAELTSTTTQTVDGCTNTTDPTAPNYGLMDGSDIGPNGVDWDDVCTQSGIVPQVTVTLAGSAPTTFTDTGQVLNTGGVDSAHCPPPTGSAENNESIPWTPIGDVPSVACGATALSLAPPTQTDRAGATATVTAKLVTGCGEPVQGSEVQFHVTGQNAPDAGQTGSAATDANGNVTFTYPEISATNGTDQVQAEVSNPAGNVLSNVVTVIWNGAATASKGPLSSITKLSLRPKSFVAARAGLTVLPAKKSKSGTTVSYHESLAAIATFTVLEQLPGRKHGRTCVAPGRAPRGAKACVRTRSIGYFSHTDVAGVNRFEFSGRLNGRKLPNGAYVLSVTPHDAAGAGATRLAPFKIRRG